MKCSLCGAENKEGVLFCSECGKALIDEPIHLDLEQINIPAAARKTRIIKVNAKKAGAEEPVQEPAPESEAPAPAEEDEMIYFSQPPREEQEATASQQEQAGEQPVNTAQEGAMKKRNWLPVFILTAIPCVNIIMLLIWAFSSKTNPSKKSFAQLLLIFILIGTVLAVAGVFVYAAFFQVDLAGMLPFKK